MTKKTKINIVILGSNPRLYNIKRIQFHKSRIFEIIGVDIIQHLPEMDGVDWGHTCDTLQKIVINDSSVSDFTVAITGNRLDDNYYIKRLGPQAGVMSYFMLVEAIQSNGNTIDNFILRNLYELEAIFRQHNGSLAPGDRSFVHDDTRGCLFDMNGWKGNIVYSLHKPILCDECLSRLRGKSLPSEYIDILIHEISRIQKPLYNRIVDWIKIHPWKAFIFASIWALILNVAASVVYDCIIYKVFPIKSAQQVDAPEPASPAR